MESLCPWKYIEYLQSISLRGITAKTCTNSRVHAFNYRSETWNLFTCIMVNKYYSRIQWKQQLKQVLQVLTNFKQQEPHVLRVRNQKKKKICAKNICCYTSTASIVLTYLRVLIKMYFVPFCSSKAITDSSQHWFFFFAYMYKDIRCCTPVAENLWRYHHTVNHTTCSVMSRSFRLWTW